MATTRAGSGQIQPNIKLEGNEGIVIPVGTTAQRNPNPVEGEIRFNTDLNTFEGYTGQIWGGMGPFPFVKSEYFEGDGSTYTFALEQQVANPDDLTVLLNGVQLRPGIDFQLIGQRNIVFEEDDGTIRPPDSGSTVSIRYFVPITSASVIANSISIEELAHLVKEIVGFQGYIKWDKTKPDGTTRKLMDSSKLKKLGWMPKYDLSSGLRSVYEWYKKEGMK